MSNPNGKDRALDDLDRRILAMLQADGRLANVDLAGRIGLSPSSTLERVRRLERDGIIRGFTARIDPGALGHQVAVFVGVTMLKHDRAALDRFEAAIVDVPAVLECHHVAGEYDYLLKVLAEDVESLRQMLVEKLSVLPGVGRIHTTLVLHTSKQVLDVPQDLVAAKR